MSRTPLAKRITALWSDLGGEAGDVDSLTVRGEGALPSVFATSDLATASISCAALALEKWRRAQGAAKRAITVDHRLSSYWFGFSFKAVDWTPPPLWDALAGDYRGWNGWFEILNK